MDHSTSQFWQGGSAAMADYSVSSNHESYAPYYNSRKHDEELRNLDDNDVVEVLNEIAPIQHGAHAVSLADNDQEWTADTGQLYEPTEYFEDVALTWDPEACQQGDNDLMIAQVQLADDMKPAETLPVPYIPQYRENASLMPVSGCTGEAEQASPMLASYCSGEAVATSGILARNEAQPSRFRVTVADDPAEVLCNSLATTKAGALQPNERLQRTRPKRARKSLPPKEKAYARTEPYADPKQEKRRRDAIKSKEQRIRDKNHVKGLEEKVSSLEFELREKNALVCSKDYEIAQKDCVIAQKDCELAQKDCEIAQKDCLIIKWKTAFKEYEGGD